MTCRFKYWNDCVHPLDIEALWLDPQVRTEWLDAGETKGENVHLSRDPEGQPFLTQTEMRVRKIKLLFFTIFIFFFFASCPFKAMWRIQVKSNFSIPLHFSKMFIEFILSKKLIDFPCTPFP